MYVKARAYLFNGCVNCEGRVGGSAALLGSSRVGGISVGVETQVDMFCWFEAWFIGNTVNPPFYNAHIKSFWNVLLEKPIL